MKFIIHRQNDSLVLTIPNPDMDINQVAKKDVPTGVKYKILDGSELPDPEFQAAWEYDFTNSFDGVGA